MRHASTPWPRISRLAITFLVAVTLLVPAAYWFAPALHRWQMLSKVTAEDAQARARGLSFIIRRARPDPAVFKGAVAILEEPKLPRERFLALVQALTDAGVWARPDIPADPWLRWLELLTSGGDASAQHYAAVALRDESRLADDKRVTAMLGRLLKGGDEHTRAEALTSATRLAGRGGRGHRGGDAEVYAKLIAQATEDPLPRLARRAWIVLGLMDTGRKLAPHWQDAPPELAQAMLWALAHTCGPDTPPIAQALASPRTRPAAAMAYALSAAAEVQRPKAKAPPPPILHAIAPGRPLTLWRLVLGIDPAQLPLDPWRSRVDAMIRDHTWDTSDAPLSGPLLAVIHREAHRLIGDRPPAQVIHDWPPLAQLAVLEALPPGSIAAVPPDSTLNDLPPLLALTYLDQARAPDPDAFYRLLSADDPTRRDIACVTAARRLTGDQAAGLIDRLLHDFNDHARMSAGILAGLTGQRLDQVRRRAEAEHTWAVQQMMRLGLWMRGENQALPGGAAALLQRADLPATTVMLAMFHRGKLGPALAFLFNTDGPAPDDLVTLLGQKRWWRVLELYLPPDAPRFWPWADAPTTAMQVDILRAWVLLGGESLTESGKEG